MTLRSSITTLICAGIILPAAFLFSLAADLPHVFMTVISGLILSLISRKPVKFNDRAVIYSIVISLISAILFDYVFPMSDDRFEYLSSLFNLNITLPLLFYLAVATTFFGVKRYSYAMSTASAVVALAFGGNVLAIPITAERFIVPDMFLESFSSLYITCICISGFFILLACRNNVQVKINRKMRKYRSRRLIIYLCIATMAGPGSYGFYKLFLYYENELRGLQNTLLNPMFFKNRSGRTVFGEGADLNQIISPEMLDNQAQIVIRAITRNEPGYLRGKAYNVYSSGRWTQAKDTVTLSMRLRESEGDDYKSFSITSKAKAKHSIEILVSSKLFSKVLFLPGNFTQIDIIASGLRYTVDGNVSFQDWINDAGYTIYRPKNISDSAWQQPVEPINELYRQVPEKLHKGLDKIITTMPVLKEPVTDEKKIYILLQYFQNNFEYKIREQPINTVDPVFSFLEDTKEGHCELYASSMILLLRRLGIPARYVTGFICAERHPMGTYYVARLGNAHAWVEAFDRENKKWVLVEPTPASGAPNYKHEWSVTESWMDIIKKAFQELLANLRRGYFARAIIGFFVSLWDFIVIIFYDSIRGPILSAIIISLAVYYIRHRRRRRMLTHNFASPDEMFIDLSKSYRKILKQLKIKYELDLSDSSTINDFIGELSKSEMPEPQKQSLIKLLREYEAMRYRKESPSQEVYHDFKKRFHL